MKPILTVENVSKQYRIGATHTTLGERLNEIFSAPLQRSAGRKRATGIKTVCALRGVSFDVHPGEVIGIIGRNGSGKSTLLKIISAITEPTSGSVKLYGRCGSLLEVGTGFHPELTGRDNIYLNGAILGMKRNEIRQSFDEIVSFAEVDSFIDTPVKRYSTGMYLRLAFAVAAHLRTEILMIDEVLAVGDMDFQKKCLGKVEGVAKDGRTVLFVSHNLGAISELCQRALWLNEGHLALDGGARAVVAAYFANAHAAHYRWQRSAPDMIASDEAKRVFLRSIQIHQGGRPATEAIQFDQEFSVEIEYQVTEAVSDLSVVLRIVTESGTVIFTSSDTDILSERTERTRPGGVYVAGCKIPGNLLRSGKVFLTVGIRQRGIWIELEENILMFEISPVGNPLHPERKGVITPVLEWTTRFSDRFEASGPATALHNRAR